MWTRYLFWGQTAIQYMKDIDWLFLSKLWSWFAEDARHEAKNRSLIINKLKSKMQMLVWEDERGNFDYNCDEMRIFYLFWLS